MNIEITDYAFIDRNLVSEIYELLEINFIRLVKSKKLRDYDNQIVKRFIIEIFYLNLVFFGYKKLIVSMLITDLDQYAIILNKF